MNIREIPGYYYDHGRQRYFPLNKKVKVENAEKSQVDKLLSVKAQYLIDRECRDMQLLRYQEYLPNYFRFEHDVKCDSIKPLLVMEVVGDRILVTCNMGRVHRCYIESDYSLSVEDTYDNFHIPQHVLINNSYDAKMNGDDYFLEFVSSPNIPLSVGHLPVGRHLVDDGCSFVSFSAECTHILYGEPRKIGYRAISGVMGLSHSGIKTKSDILCADVYDDLKLFIVGCRDGSLGIWDMRKRVWSKPEIEHGNAVHRIHRVSATEVCAIGLSGKISVYDIFIGQKSEFSLNGHQNTHYPIGSYFDRDTNSLFACGMDGVIRCWDISRRDPYYELKQLSYWCRTLFICHTTNKDRILISHGDGGIKAFVTCNRL